MNHKFTNTKICSYIMMTNKGILCHEHFHCGHCLSIKVVTAGLMDIYQRILGLKFTKIEGGEVLMCYDMIA